jgi:hypothetical protein
MIRRLGGLQVFECPLMRLLPPQPLCTRGVFCHRVSLPLADSAFSFLLLAFGFWLLAFGFWQALLLKVAES